MASTTLEQMVVELVADVRGYQAELAKSQQHTREWSQDVQRHTANVGRAFAALGLGAVATGLAAITSRALDAAEQTQRMAVALGANVESVQELGFAFREFGLDADDVADALNTLADRSEDAQAGTKSFIEDFELLGVSVDELRGLRPEEIFSLVAQEVAKIEDPTQRAAGVVRIFGDDLGRRLLPLLIQGREGFADLAAEARELGAVLDAEAVESMVAANREFRQIRNLIDAQLAQAVADNADSLHSLAGGIALAGEAAIGAYGAVNRFFDRITKEIAAEQYGIDVTDILPTEEAIEDRIARIEDLRERIAEAEGANFLQNAAREGPLTALLFGDEIDTSNIEAYRESIAELRDELAGLLAIDTSAFPERVAGRIGPPATADDDGGSAAGDNFKLARQAALHAKRLMDEEQREIDQNQKIIDLQEERFRKIHEMALESTDQLIALERYRFEQQQRELDAEEDRLRERNLITLELEAQFQQAREELEQGHLARLEQIREDQVQRVNDGTVFEELSAYADQAARNMQDAFADFLFDPFEDGLDGMLESFVETLQRMAAEAAAAQIFDALGGLSGSNNAILSSIGSFFAGQRQHGGGVGAHQAYIVGEKRPEVFVPGVSGSVIPNVAGGGGNVELHIHNEGTPISPQNTEVSQGPDGRTVIRAWFRNEVMGMLQSGELDRPMAAMFGVRRRGG